MEVGSVVLFALLGIFFFFVKLPCSMGQVQEMGEGGQGASGRGEELFVWELWVVLEAEYGSK